MKPSQIEQRRITTKAEADEAIAAVVTWLETKPELNAEVVLRQWALELLDGRVDDMHGCPLCQS